MIRTTRRFSTIIALGACFALGIHIRPARAHCDGLDGPVVTAAREALRTGNVNHVLIWVQADDEADIRRVFEHTLAVRALSPEARDLAATTGRFYSPEEALPAGWLDQVVPADAVLSTAQTVADMLTQIDMGSHHATKLRVRADALKELREAIETELTAETLATQAP